MANKLRALINNTNLVNLFDIDFTSDGEVLILDSAQPSGLKFDNIPSLWTRDAVNALLYPTNAGDGIFLPDDIEMNFGNVLATPYTSMRWNSGSSRFEFDSPYIYHAHTYDDNDPHYQWRKIVERNRVGATVAGITYIDYLTLELRGTQNITGNQTTTISELKNYNTAAVSNAKAMDFQVKNESAGGTISYATGSNGLIQQTDDTGYIYFGYGFQSSTYNYGKRNPSMYDISGFRSFVRNWDTGVIAKYKGFNAVAPVSPAGSITDYYAIYVEDPVVANVTNPWAIYIAGGLFETKGDIAISADDKKLMLGAGLDAEIFVDSSDNFNIKNVTQDKDIDFWVNNGGTSLNLIHLDGADAEVEIGTPGTDASLFEEDGSLTLIGDARKYVYKWVGAASGYGNPAKSPSFTKHGTGAALQFDDNKQWEAIVNVQVPEDADYDEDMYICIGWSQDTLSEVGNDCHWNISYTITAIDDVVAAGATGSFSVDEAASATNDGLTLTLLTIPNANISSSDVCLHISIERDATAGSGDTIAGSVYLYGVSLKYVRNRLGADLP